MIKVDVEGGEVDVLEGGQALFEQRPPSLVFIETHNESLFHQCVTFLQAYGYQVFSLGCPKVEFGGDLYPLMYDLYTDTYTVKSGTRFIAAMAPGS